MSTKQIISEIVSESGLSLSTIAEKAGYKRPSNISEFMRSENMRVDNMLRILTACGYRVVIKSERKDIPDRELTLD